MTPIRSAVALVLFATAATPCLAMEAEEELALAYGDKETVTIATGSAQPLRRAPSVATVITAEEIRAMGARDLDEVMETIPGVHVSYTNRYFSVYQVRGIYGTSTNPQMLILQNGIPMNTLYRGDKAQGWGGMPLENVARIEVIRGPGSALYGADAFAGAINIVTKTAADAPGSAAGLRGGSFDSGEAWLRHGGRWGAAEVAGYLRLGHTDGQDETVQADAQTARDKSSGTRASLAPGPVSLGYDALDAALDFNLDHWRLRTAYKLRDDMGVGAGISSALDPEGWERSERASADLSWTDPEFHPDWGLGFTASLLYYSEVGKYQLSPPGSKFGPNTFLDGMLGQPERYELQTRLSAFAIYSGVAGHGLRFGLGHDDLDMYKTATHKNYFLNERGVPVPSELMDYQDIQPHQLPAWRAVNYLYAQDEWSFTPDWTLTAGVRHDNYSDFGGTTNPRLALVWDASLDLTAKLLYGQAFRAPSFTELYGINPVANGNPALQPETIRTLEAAFAWQASPEAKLDLGLFHYQMDDVIRVVTNPAPNVGGAFQNSGGQHGVGLELEATWDAGRNLRLIGNYSWQRSIDEATDADAGLAPHHQIYARADWQFASPWQLSGQVNWVADRERAAGDPRPPVEDYTTVDLTLRTTRRGAGRWNLAASVRNLFDVEAYEPSAVAGQLPYDLPLPGRTLWVEATYDL